MMPFKRFPWSLFTLFMLVLLLLGCTGGDGAVATQRFTPQPSATFTPRSTELPLVATPILIGSEEMPIKVLLVGEEDSATQRVIRELNTALNDELDTFRLGYYEGIVVEVELVANQQELLYRLCNSNDTIGFADSLTFIAAERQCGATPALQVEIDGRSGTNFDLVVFAQRVFSLRDLRGRAICAVSLDDRTSFVHLSMALKAEGVDPLDDLAEVVTGYTSDTDMVLAVAGRYEPGQRPRCDAAAIADDTFEDIRAELVDESREQNLTETQANNLLRVLDDDNGLWRQLPYPILVLPPDRLLPNYLSQEVVQAFVGIEADDGEAKANLQIILPHDNLKEVNTNSYTTFRDWVTATGWDMADLPAD